MNIQLITDFVKEGRKRFAGKPRRRGQPQPAPRVESHPVRCLEVPLSPLSVCDTLGPKVRGRNTNEEKVSHLRSTLIIGAISVACMQGERSGFVLAGRHSGLAGLSRLPPFRLSLSLSLTLSIYLSLLPPLSLPFFFFIIITFLFFSFLLFSEPW